MELLEREAALASLSGWFGECSDGHGLLVLVSGEAGAGKTALVEAFCRSRAAGRPVLLGACDPLGTPRPLGPLVDIASQLGGTLAEVVHQRAAARELMTVFVDDLRRLRGPIVVVEDLHWADDATLDLIRFVARRLDRIHALVIATLRDDELPPGHPTRVMLGDIAGFQRVRRTALESLSPGAVAQLARESPLDAVELHGQTGGNAFFVTEAIAAGVGLPQTARDAVLARASRLSRHARVVLDAAAVAGPALPADALRRVAEADAEDIDSCIGAGMLEPVAAGLAFRHDVARRAVLEAIAPMRRTELHRRVLTELERETAPVDLAELARHAVASGHGDAILQYARKAAARAAELGAHREAADHLATALSFAERLPEDERANLYGGYAREAALVDRVEEAIEACERAIDLRRQLGQTVREGEDVRWLSRLFWMSRRSSEATRTGRRAVEILKRAPPGPELATAYATLSYQLAMELERSAFEWAQRALELAQRLDHPESLAHAEVALSLCRALAGEPDGVEALDAASRQAAEQGFDEIACRALFQLVRVEQQARRYEQAERFAERALAFCEEHNVEFWRYYTLAFQAWMALDQGRWHEAQQLATFVQAQSGRGAAAVRSTVVNVVLAQVGARTGRFAETEPPLAEALAICVEMPAFDWMFGVHSAEAERAWLGGDEARARRAARAALDSALAAEGTVDERARQWAVGEAAAWLWRVGGLEQPPPGAAQPYRLEILGDWRGAADAFADAGRPYERALALFGADEPAVLLEALSELRALDAHPAARLLERRLRNSGIRRLPRPRRATTKAHPAGLTTRQQEVLELLVSGLRDAEIAERLVISERTVNHHVAAILDKLGVATRVAAAAEAQRLDLVART